MPKQTQVCESVWLPCIPLTNMPISSQPFLKLVYMLLNSPEEFNCKIIFDKYPKNFSAALWFLSDILGEDKEIFPWESNKL